MKYTKALLYTLCTLVLFMFIQSNDDMDFGGGDPYSEEGMMDASYGGMGEDPYGDPYGMGGMMGGDPYGGGNPAYDGNSAPQAPPAREFFSVDEINDFINENVMEGAVIGYFDELENEEDKEAFDEVSQLLGTITRFGFTHSRAILDELKYAGCVVTIYKPSHFVNDKYEKVKSRYPGKNIKIESLNKFILEKSIPLVGELTEKSADFYQRANINIVTIFTEIDHVKNAQFYTYVSNRVRKVAVDFKGKFLFNIADKKSYKKDLKAYGITNKLSDSDDIAVGLIDVKGFFYYKMDDIEPFSSESLRKFLNDFNAGVYVGKGKAMSNDNGDENEESDENSEVVAINDGNYDELSNVDADIMIEFYAPWCGHCKSLKPEYEDLAQAFADDSSVIIAAMDATSSTVPEIFDIQGYPTIMFLSRDDKSNPISYEGGRDAQSMIDFVNTHKSK